MKRLRITLDKVGAFPLPALLHPAAARAAITAVKMQAAIAHRPAFIREHRGKEVVVARAKVARRTHLPRPL
jgi:hypothetical protein